MKTTLIVIKIVCLSWISVIGQIAPPSGVACSSTLLEETFSASVLTGWTGDFDITPLFLEGWILTDTSTATTLTGPDSSFEGSHYVYLETSGPADPGDTYEITTPTVSLPSTGASALSFYTLMYGNETGALTINVITTTGTTELLKIVGEQHNSGDITNWEEVYLDLSTYSGQDVQIQFVGMKGTGDMGDMAIDAVNICQLQPQRVIPTLGEWGLIILSLLLTIFALTSVKAKSLQPILEKY